tara:strand:- start:457 stop:603 length:147 start_codon:yes stop_codon:yes gene_type:complete
MKNESELIDELRIIATQLGGELNQTITLNSSGRSSKKIIIEYDVEQRV